MDTKLTKAPLKLVLLVDDEAPLRELMAHFLTRSGYCVVEAASAAEGLALFEAANHEFDLILTDFEMPGGMNGLQLIDRIRALNPNVPILMCSGSLSVESEGTLDVPFLRKPFQASALVQNVQRLLNEKNSAPVLAA